MFQPITSLLLSKSSIERLYDSGYQYYEDVLRSDVPWIREMCEEIKTSGNCKLETALDFWQREGSPGNIVTMSRSLDEALGGGVPRGAVTELCGLPGTGKTQLCLQLCVTVQIPQELGGAGGEAVYIDTAANFTILRLKDMASAWKNDYGSFIPDWDLSNVLSRVHFMEAFGSAKFCASIEILKSFLDKNSKIALIVIDGIAFPFKDGCPEVDRTAILYRTISTLEKIAIEKNIAVVLTNEMSNRAGLGVVTALGDAWSHRAPLRVLLQPPLVAITHSSSHPDTTAQIQINEKGIRDC